MPDDKDHLFKRLERNRFAAGNDPNEVLGNQRASISSVSPAGFVSELMRDGTGRVSNDGSGIIVKDGSDVERVRLGKLATNSYGLRVTNPGGTVIIDGTSDVFRIAATGTLSIAAGPDGVAGQLFKTASVDVATGFDYVPTFIGMVLQGSVGAQLGMYFDWVQDGGFTDSYGVTDSYEMTNQVVGGDETRIGVRWKTSDLYDRSGLSSTFRFYILEQIAF